MVFRNLNNSDLGPLWRAAYGFAAENDSLVKLCNHIESWSSGRVETKLLSMSSVLLNGACRLYKSALEELLEDCNDLLMDMVSPKTGRIQLHPEEESSNDTEIEISCNVRGIEHNSDPKGDISNIRPKEVDSNSSSNIESEENSRSLQVSDSSSSSRKRRASIKSAQNEKRSRTTDSETTLESEESNQSRSKSSSVQSNEAQSCTADPQTTPKRSISSVTKEQSIKSNSTQTTGVESCDTDTSLESKESNQESQNQKDSCDQNIIEEQSKEGSGSSQRTEFEERDDSSRSSGRNMICEVEQPEISRTPEIPETNLDEPRFNTDPDDNEVEEAIQEFNSSKSSDSNNCVTNILSVPEAQIETALQKATTRDVEVQVGSFLSRQQRLPMEESFDENLPFGFVVVYDNLYDRFPSKLIFTSMNVDVAKL